MTSRLSLWAAEEMGCVISQNRKMEEPVSEGETKWPEGSTGQQYHVMYLLPPVGKAPLPCLTGHKVPGMDKLVRGLGKAAIVQPHQRHGPSQIIFILTADHVPSI